MPRYVKRSLFAAALLGALVVPAVAVFDVIDTSLYLLNEDMVQDEDLYLASNRANIAGVIEGDLVAATGSLTISGTVTGDVFVISQGRVHVTAGGEVQGSLRAAARDVDVDGTVGADVAATALTTTVNGEVSRDVLVITGSFALNGSIGRDLRGRFINGSLSGSIGNDVDVTVQRLSIGDDFELGGDLLYHSNREVSIPDGASISGQVVQLPSAGTFAFSVWWNIAKAMSILAFLVSGIVLLWLFRHTGARAAGLVRTKPWPTLGIGVAALIAAPLLIVLLIVSVVGVPVAILLAVLYALGLLLSPVPAVTAAGDWALRGRGGLFGAFLLGGLVWRLGVEIIPWVGLLLYIAALAWGTGGWVMAAWQERQRAAPPQALLPPSMQVAEEADEPEVQPDQG